jgi:protein-tyrosine-phosphatase
VEVLFVCFGNINRSQIAEALFNRLSKNHHASSAGIAPRRAGIFLKDEHNNPVVPMANLGYDLSQAKIKKLDERAVNSTQRIVVLLNREKCERKLPEYLRRRKEDLEFWDIEKIGDDIAFEKYCRLEDERIKQIEIHVRDLVNRLG